MIETMNDKELIGVTDFQELLLDPKMMFYVIIPGSYNITVPIDRAVLYEKFSLQVDVLLDQAMVNDVKVDCPYALIRRSRIDPRVILIYNVGTLEDCCRPGMFRKG